MLLFVGNCVADLTAGIPNLQKENSKLTACFPKLASVYIKSSSKTRQLAERAIRSPAVWWVRVLRAKDIVDRRTPSSSHIVHPLSARNRDLLPQMQCAVRSLVQINSARPTPRKKDPPGTGKNIPVEPIRSRIIASPERNARSIYPHITLYIVRRVGHRFAVCRRVI